jgi:hypothetical protein
MSSAVSAMGQAAAGAAVASMVPTAAAATSERVNVDMTSSPLPEPVSARVGTAGQA